MQERNAEAHREGQRPRPDDRLKVGMVQINSGPDVEANLDMAASLIEQAARSGAALVCLPEAFSYRGPFDRAIPESLDGRIVGTLARLAADNRVWVLGGGLWEISTDPGRPYNTAVMLGPDGQLVARYRKLHLFRVSMGHELTEDESQFTTPGDDLITVQIGPWTLGLMTCFDVRFPEQARALVLRGANVLAVPSNFAADTGRDHWEVLLRARAIENHVYVVAPAEVGATGGWSSYGRTLAVDPWGTIISQAADEEGVVLAELTLDRLAAVRSALPTMVSRRPDVYGNPGP
jgi:deaminated glutathione amidase